MTSVIISVQVNLILSYSENNLLPTQDGLSEIARRNEASELSDAACRISVLLGTRLLCDCLRISRLRYSVVCFIWRSDGGLLIKIHMLFWRNTKLAGQETFMPCYLSAAQK